MMLAVLINNKDNDGKKREERGGISCREEISGC